MWNLFSNKFLVHLNLKTSDHEKSRTHLTSYIRSANN